MSAKKRDEIKIGPEIAPGIHAAIRRDENGERRVAVGAAEDGDPIMPDSEIASISRECRDGWHTIETIYKSGPTQVATPEYRKGYDRIFGKKQPVGLA